MSCPSCARRTAVAAPMPREPPVMSATAIGVTIPRWTRRPLPRSPAVVSHSTVRVRRTAMQFSRELRNDVLTGDITLSVRLWQRPRVKSGGRYRVGPGEIEVDAIELFPFSAVSAQDVRRSGEPDLEALRRRAAHAGPIDEDTLVYRIEFHTVS